MPAPVPVLVPVLVVMDALLFGYGQVWHMGSAPPFTRPCRGISSSTMASRSAHHGGGEDGMRRREGDTERGNVTRRNICNSEVLAHVHTSVEKNIRHTALMLNLTLSPSPSTASHPVPLALGLLSSCPSPHWLRLRLCPRLSSTSSRQQSLPRLVSAHHASSIKDRN